MFNNSILSDINLFLLNVFNFRTVTTLSAVTAGQKTYDNFFNQVNQKDEKYQFF